MLEDLKDLERFLKICRKSGVDEISFEGGIKVRFGELPLKSTPQAESDEATLENPDDLIYYAVNNPGVSQ